MPCDYKRYPVTWNIIRAGVLSRAGNRCELCTAENYKPHPITGKIVVLTVAHMDDETDKDGNYVWNDMKDLLALCQRCHNKIDLPKRRHRRKNKPRPGAEENLKGG
jgi:hypothetical protein